MRYIFLTLLFAVAASCGDSESSPKDNGSPSDNGNTSGRTNATLVIGDAEAVDFSELRCIYRQITGAIDDLELQLQWLATPDTVAYALYMDRLEPATPFSVLAGDTSASFRFEVFVDGAAYTDQFSNAEVGVELEALPDPDSLNDGDEVTLRGSLVTQEFILNDRSPTVGSIIVAEQRVAIDCTTSFAVAVAENGEPGF